jgi:D-alanine transaminase
MSLSDLLDTHAQDPLASMDAPAFLNGRWCRLQDAQVSVLDRGFVFGDGIYEVVPVYGRNPLDWSLHRARLLRSLEAVQIHTPLAPQDWDNLVHALIAAEPAQDQFIYCQVTRGVARRDHAFPRPSPSPTIFATTSPLKRPDERTRAQGVRALTLPDQRWQRCDIKSIALLANVLAREQAVAAGAQEAILLRDGILTEGAASNIWVVRDGAILAPKPSGQLLEGIRRATLPRLAEALGVAVHWVDVSEQALLEADELLMTSATKEILAITALNGQPVGTAKPGPVYEALRQAYDQRIEACIRGDTGGEISP